MGLRRALGVTLAILVILWASAVLAQQTYTFSGITAPVNLPDATHYDGILPMLIKASNGNIIEFYGKSQPLDQVGNRREASIKISTNNGATFTDYTGGTQVTTVQITNFGSGYTSTPTCTLSGNATCTAAAPVNGFIPSAFIVANGSGYDEPPDCVLSGGGGSGATCMVNWGPTVANSGTGQLLNWIQIVSGGSGYSSAPGCTLTNHDNFGTGATCGAASPVNGAIPSVSVVSAGSGYSSPPTCTITGGGGSGATCKAMTNWCYPATQGFPGDSANCWVAVPWSSGGIVGLSGGVIPGTGTITFVYSATNQNYYFGPGTCCEVHSEWIYYTRSTDNGVNWSKPALLNTAGGSTCVETFPAVVPTYPTGSCFYGLAYGPMIYGPVGFGGNLQSFAGNGMTYVVWTYDDGVHWGVDSGPNAGYLNILAFSTAEMGMLYVGSSTYIGFVRDGNGTPIFFYSTNGGSSWTQTKTVFPKAPLPPYFAGANYNYEDLGASSDPWVSMWMIDPKLPDGSVTAFMPERTAFCNNNGVGPGCGWFGTIRTITFKPSAAIADPSFSTFGSPQVFVQNGGETKCCDFGYGAALMTSGSQVLYVYMDQIGACYPACAGTDGSPSNMWKTTAQYPVSGGPAPAPAPQIFAKRGSTPVPHTLFASRNHLTPRTD